MATKTYLIYQEKIIPTIGAFFLENPDYTYDCKDNGKTLIVSVSNNKSESGVLTIYFSNGKTSFNPQGKLHSICEDCRDYIIKEASLNDYMSTNRWFVYHNVKIEEYNALQEIIEGYPEVTTKSFGGNEKIVNTTLIAWKYGCTVTMTYYHSGTLQLQGILTTLLMQLVSDVISLLDADKVTKGGTYMTVLGESAHPIISMNLDEYLEHREILVNTPYEQLIFSSISLINSDIILPDYSSMIHDALRALEGIIGKRLHEAKNFEEAHPLIGSRFQKDGATGMYTLPSSIAADFPTAIIVSKLEDAYNFYCRQRHTTFHSVFLLPNLTRTIPTKDEAANLLLDVIRHINSILRNW